MIMACYGLLPDSTKLQPEPLVTCWWLNIVNHMLPSNIYQFLTAITILGQFWTNHQTHRIIHMATLDLSFVQMCCQLRDVGLKSVIVRGW